MEGVILAGAGVQDRDGAPDVLRFIGHRYLRLRDSFAES